jgi:hypothetical protein
MTTTTQVATPQADVRAAHVMLTTFLVQGCEQALFDLRRSLGSAEHSAEVRIGLLAADLMEEVLESWRDAGRALGGQPVEEPSELLLGVHCR